jgi:hypothetical protein
MSDVSCLLCLCAHSCVCCVPSFARFASLREQHVQRTLDGYRKIDSELQQTRLATRASQPVFDERLRKLWTDMVDDRLEKIKQSIARKNKRAKILLKAGWFRHVNRIGLVVYDTWGSFVLYIVLFFRFVISVIKSAVMK